VLLDATITSSSYFNSTQDLLIDFNFTDCKFSYLSSFIKKKLKSDSRNINDLLPGTRHYLYKNKYTY